MKSGLLWFDNSPKTLTEKIESAAKRYREKFGQSPDTCFVNPRDFDTQTPAQHQGVTIGTKATVMPNHLWLGVSGDVIIAAAQTAPVIVADQAQESKASAA